MSVKPRGNSLIIAALVTAVLGFALFLFYWFLIFIDGYVQIGGHLNLENSSHIGGFIGGTVGTITSFVAVILIYQTYRLQDEELQETRKELQQTRKEVAKQNFSNHFFELLKVHRQNVSEIDYGDFIGRRAIKRMVLDIEEIIKDIPESVERCDIKASIFDRYGMAYLFFFYGIDSKKGARLSESKVIELNEQYSFWVDTVKKRLAMSRAEDSRGFKGNQYRLGHYYRHLFHTIEYIDNYTFDAKADISETESKLLKQSFSNILRSQLSDDEVALFVTNILSPWGKEWVIRGYIDEYDLLRNIHPSYYWNLEIPEVIPTLKNRWKTELMS